MNREPADLGAFLAEACGDDQELKAEVQSMLERDKRKTKCISPVRRGLLTETITLQLARGAMLEQYRIVEHIGASGMGTVYNVLDTKLSRQLALKLFRPEALDGTAGGVDDKGVP